ncbi:hypothetical protein GCM10009834_01940 [Streptomonospora arabica]
MPADRLNAGLLARDSADVQGAERLADAVVQVLSGASLEEAASLVSIAPRELAAAVELYDRAGRAALRQDADTDWWQIYLSFSDWHDAETAAAAHLLPLLSDAEAAGAQWWFIRKYPEWRLRIRPRQRVESTLAAGLDELAAAGHIADWWHGLYEPETTAFGGADAMCAAHRLFHVDSRSILHHSRGTVDYALGPRELSTLLCTVMLRAAGLEWFEQGDVWHRVCAERPLPDDVSPARLQPMTAQLEAILRTQAEKIDSLFTTGDAAQHATMWTSAFRELGTTLGQASRHGRLHRGLREVLAYHVIFHWNRIGLPSRTQSALAHSARGAILEVNARQ